VSSETSRRPPPLHGVSVPLPQPLGTLGRQEQRPRPAAVGEVLPDEGEPAAVAVGVHVVLGAARVLRVRIGEHVAVLDEPLPELALLDAYLLGDLTEADVVLLVLPVLEGLDLGLGLLQLELGLH
jgi:hypothetical protein